MSVVVPVGVIVAVAIVCIVVAVLSSAQRADEVALAQERHLLSTALQNFGRGVLRETDSVASSQAAFDHVRQTFNPAWVEERAGSWLGNYFHHDLVLIFDKTDQPIYSRLGRFSVDGPPIDLRPPAIIEILDTMRGRNERKSNALSLSDQPATDAGARAHVAELRLVMGRPAAVAAVAIGDDRLAAAYDTEAPILMSVKFLNAEVLNSIGAQLGLSHLRIVARGTVPAGDYLYQIGAPDGSLIVELAWTPKQPGAEIVRNVVPFIAVALAGFALLGAFVLRYMRRTAVAIAAGENRLRHLALHDPLCGLPNRIFFSERLEAVIEEVAATGMPAALFYIDLDHFKDVNDTLGHPVGDELIRNVTLRLSHTLRGGDMVARLGGDEFAVISSIGGDSALLMALGQRIISAICAPYSVGGQNIVIGASIGIAIIDRNCAGGPDIMRYADMALYRAKNEGRNRACIYDNAMDADLSKRKLLEGDLREAIKHGQLRLLYQPIVDKSGDVMLGVEALCRWTHPTRGEISPAEFIPLAENSGLIVELGAWVLRKAMLDGLAWPSLTVAVNVSPLQFRRADFADLVERTLAETGFDPARLELEITESVLIGNFDTAETSMLRLKALGVRLALDDFGTGYSSLLYLRRFPFDKLKIDRSFVLSIEKAADAAAIVHAVVSLGRGLGMKVTAEGVETADQHLFLRAAGVHSMQGYRFGRAMAPDKIAARLEAPEAFKVSGDQPTSLAG
ncbi:EAL domain-containing protein [Undibacter mobilis]|uniref:EAL domain-containing protein n=1 Tax=Undibacter mobilis TaxID=2292256 RepID=A0A371BD36_9BRAD|nr:EAL domain-containing protein [Undibacter mobilis]